MDTLAPARPVGQFCLELETDRAVSAGNTPRRVGGDFPTGGFHAEALGRGSVQPVNERRRGERRAQVVAGGRREWKHNEEFSLVPKALGASHQDGADFYVAATKVRLDGPLDHIWIADVTLRASEANQLAILGFGGDRGDYHLFWRKEALACSSPIT